MGICGFDFQPQHEMRAGKSLVSPFIVSGNGIDRIGANSNALTKVPSLRMLASLFLHFAQAVKVLLRSEGCIPWVTAFRRVSRRYMGERTRPERT